MKVIHDKGATLIPLDLKIQRRNLRNCYGKLSILVITTLHWTKAKPHYLKRKTTPIER